MFPDSLIDPATDQAYRQTHYCVQGATPMTLQVDEPNATLAALYQARRVDCCAFITACNPYSHALDDASNAERQAHLARELRQRSLQWLDGIGQHPSNQWPGEESFLVWGLSLEASQALGKQYEQNAIIWCGSDAVPRLVYLRGCLSVD